MALLESFVCLAVGKQGFHPFYFEFHLKVGGKLGSHLLHGIAYLFFGMERGADGGEQMGMLCFYNMFLIQLQRTDKSLFQLG